MTEALELIGGEMAAWTEPRPRVGGGALAALVAALRPESGSALVLGPHGEEIFAALAGAPVTALVRGVSDAVAPLQRRGEVRMLCGSITKLPEQTYALVVAADGLGRLASVEGFEPAWAQLFERVAACVGAGGTLLVALENPLGPQRVFALDEHTGDEAWSPASDDETRPATLEQFLAAVRAAGLTPQVGYAAFPTPSAPTLFVDEVTPALAGLVSSALAPALGGEPLLADPARFVADALRAGLGAELAPAWYVVATRDAVPLALPKGLAADAAVAQRWAVPVELRERDGELARVPARIEVVEAGPVRREPAELTGALPTGRRLAELLLGLAQRRDLPALRAVLTRYGVWLASLGDRVPFAVAENVLLDGDRQVLTDPSWHWVEPVRFEVAAASVLHSFAVTALSRGYSHAWPASLDAAALTVLLAGMAGLSIDEQDVTEAVKLRVRLEVALHDLDGEREAALHTALAEAGPGTAPVTASAYRETLLAARAGRNELARVRELLTRTEGALALAETRLSQFQRLHNLTNSRIYKLAKSVAQPLRRVKGRLGR